MARPRTRLRYRRLGAAGSALAITLVAVLGGLGVLPSDEATRPVAQATLASGATDSDAPGSGSRGGSARTATGPVVTPEESRFRNAQGVRAALNAEQLEVPEDSGTGRRVVFDQSAQRVWLVDGGDRVRRTYPVSGSVEDNLDPGSYEVYSRSERAWGIDDGGTMRFMVRFTHGTRAAIGFHDIPVKDGALVQTRDQLGTPLSSGCIRQWRPDARALWDFAPVGTTVVVVA